MIFGLHAGKNRRAVCENDTLQPDLAAVALLSSDLSMSILSVARRKRAYSIV
ncbi:hypothetical protein [Granulicella tundricola]|uniref:hypothetical protein n=1 Tax=Granulicella tundricola TaxID=940615 RepID=UPI0002E02DE0|nr:hypothetical protein [Granulicella tundricola]